MLLPPIKTSTCSSIYNCRGICSAVVLPTLLPITTTLSSATAAAAGIKYIRVYLAIAISIYVDIVYKRITDIAKDI